MKIAILLTLFLLLLANCGNKSIGANKSIENISLELPKEKADLIISQLVCLDNFEKINTENCQKAISSYDFERYFFNKENEIHYYFISRWEGFIVGGVFVGFIGCFKEDKNGKFIKDQIIVDFYSKNLIKPLAAFKKIIQNQTLLKSESQGQEIRILHYEFEEKDSILLFDSFE
ncbi:hypothetical protein [Aureispira sp. CCB-E]|uniref:hypothetical protein n=1 Tax=Aureispira sp. CCB-E TaxID=3051121 RepID=UPI0028689A28|nr:hypothetical protein [Aureispira sp. CCB-E]WMX13126.1 hypothetical protein QP953_19990 [Aureispira sp. CCB-E]